MKHHMGSVIRVTSALFHYVMGMGVPRELLMMSWLGVYGHGKLCDIPSNQIIWVNGNTKNLSMVRLIGRLGNGREFTLPKRGNT